MSPRRPPAPVAKARGAVRAVWTQARLLIAFHRDPQRRRRQVPFLWQPKGASAGLRADPEDQEAFVHLKGAAEEDDVQLKLRQDRIIARRAAGKGWSGIEVTEHGVRVLVGETWIEIGHDGGVTRRSGDVTTFLEGDGAILRLGPDVEVIVAADGSSVSRRTGEQIQVLSDDGVLSKRK